MCLHYNVSSSSTLNMKSEKRGKRVHSFELFKITWEIGTRCFTIKRKMSFLKKFQWFPLRPYVRAVVAVVKNSLLWDFP